MNHVTERPVDVHREHQQPPTSSSPGQQQQQLRWRRRRRRRRRQQQQVLQWCRVCSFRREWGVQCLDQVREVGVVDRQQAEERAAAKWDALCWARPPSPTRRVVRLLVVGRLLPDGWTGVVDRAQCVVPVSRLVNASRSSVVCDRLLFSSPSHTVSSLIPHRAWFWFWFWFWFCHTNNNNDNVHTCA